MPRSQEIRTLLKQIGGNIRRERSQQGLTQERLAELANLNIRTVQKIEAGDIDILITTAVRIQRALKCSADSLLVGSRKK